MLPRRHRPSLSAVRHALREARHTYHHRRNGAKAVQPAARTPAAPGLLERVRAKAAPPGEPDVLLDVPHLHVDEIDLKLDELDARVALRANVLDLLRLDVGIDAELRGVELDIKGVDAQALLKVRLENLTAMVDRVMETIERNPELLLGLTERLGATVGEVSGSAARALTGNGTAR